MRLRRRSRSSAAALVKVLDSRTRLEILLLLADAGGSGLTAERLSHMLFGDGSHLVTVRAEMSRLRRAVGALVTNRPYRLDADVELRVIADPDDDRGAAHLGSRWPPKPARMADSALPAKRVSSREAKRA